jgi:hypothetical protein
MKYDSYDMGKAYRRFFAVQQNQLEILQQLRMAVVAYGSLSSFAGDAADSAKAYMLEVHTGIIDSLEMVLMEMEIRLLTLRQDFAAKVDTDDNAVLNDAYISQIVDEVHGYRTKVIPHEDAVNCLISSVSDLVYLRRPSIPEYRNDLLATEDNARATLQRMRIFEQQHKNDMDNVGCMLEAIGSALTFVEGMESIKDYIPQSVSGQAWFKQINLCQLNSYKFAIASDPDFCDTIYMDFAVQTGLTMLDALIPPGVDYKAVMDILKNGNWNLDDSIGVIEEGRNLSLSSREALRIIRYYRDGIRFIPEVSAKGEIVIKAVSVSGKKLSRSMQTLALKGAEIGEDLTRVHMRALAEGLFSRKGLTISGKDASKLKAVALDPKVITALTNAAKVSTNEAGFLQNLAVEMKKLGKLGKALLGISIAIDVIDAFYDERTRKFKEFNGAKLASDMVMSTAEALAPLGVGAAAGTSIMPGIGTLVGVVVGAGVAVVGNLEYGEPSKSLYEVAGDGLEDSVHDIGNWISKVFR